MKTVTIILDRKNKKLLVKVPEPEGGPIKLQERRDAAGKSITVLPFDKATVEQKAHYVFWSNGTQERFDAAMENHEDQCDAKALMLWLVKLRIMDVKEKTGFQYQLALQDQWPEARAK